LERNELLQTSMSDILITIATNVAGLIRMCLLRLKECWSAPVKAAKDKTVIQKEGEIDKEEEVILFLDAQTQASRSEGGGDDDVEKCVGHTPGVVNTRSSC